MNDEKKSVAPILLAAAVGAAAGAAAVIILSTAGDEAPIRVKNGSLQIELMHNSQKFKDKSAKKQWTINGGKKGSANFEVYFDASPGQSQCTVRRAIGPTVTVAMNDGTTVTFSVIDEKADIKADKELNPTNDDRLLDYGSATDHWVQTITVGGQTCTLTSKDTQLSVVLLDQ